MPTILRLHGFRAFRAEVYRELAAAGLNRRALTDRALIDAWLDDDAPAALVARPVKSPARRGQGGAK